MTGQPQNLADLVRTGAERLADKPAFVAGARTLTYAELDETVDHVAAGLAARGLGQGARVGILVPNSVEFVLAYFGILRAGLVAVPLNTAYTAAELAYQLDDSETSLVFASPELASLVEGVDVLTTGSADWTALLDTAGSVPSAAATGEDLAVLLYTSGTTGRPKGAMLSHRALLANLEQLMRIEPPVVATDDVVLLVLPLFHVYGLNSGLGMCVAAGATGLLAERFDPVETLALVREHQVTNIIGAPPMYVSWSMLPEAGDSLSSLRLAVSGAAPLPPSVLEAMREVSGHQVFEGYGLTETAPVLTTTLCSAVAKPGSIGRAIPGVDRRLVDDTGDDADDDDPGEIVVRGPNLISGYWPDGAGGPAADGWFHTGDVAYADNDGDLFLVDRIRELILVSGFNVYPREVEEVIGQHPDVAEVAAIGVPHPYTGETVRALVVPRDGTSLQPESIIDFAASRLARFKCPTSVEVVDELPHSATGKVAKGRLRAE
jgi:long-chain acyl-CoA synthetase